MDQSLVMELIHSTRGMLDSIQKVAQLSRGRFVDKEFGQFFDLTITSTTEKADLLLDGFLNYIKASTPLVKKGSVNAIIGEALKKHQMRVEEKKARVFTRLEEDLPETIVPDEQLRFIMDSILRSALTSLVPGGNIEISTRYSVPSEETGGGRSPLKGNGNALEIRVAFTDHRKQGERLPRELQSLISHKDGASDLLFRLVSIIVQRNQGTMEIEADEAKLKRLIILRFPAERRKLVSYQSIDG